MTTAANGADAARPAAPDATTLARLLQFGDSMFPVGGFSFSGGLESAIATRIVTDVATLAEYATHAVAQAATGDGVGLVAAHRAAAAGDLEEAVRIDHLIHERKLSDETRLMTLRMGKKLAEMGAQVAPAGPAAQWLARIRAGATPGTYPAGLGVIFAALGQDAQHAFVVHQYGVANTILGAALRLMRVSHVDTQAILFELTGRAAADYAEATARAPADMAVYAPLVDVLAAIHSRAHVRLFMN